MFLIVKYITDLSIYQRVRKINDSSTITLCFVCLMVFGYFFLQNGEWYDISRCKLYLYNCMIEEKIPINEESNEL